MEVAVESYYTSKHNNQYQQSNSTLTNTEQNVKKWKKQGNKDHTTSVKLQC